MAFTLEDGTGVAGANAYIDETFADGYFTDRGEAGWTGTTADKQAAIIKATDFIEVRWGDRFLGRKEFPDTPQGLSFPRVNLLDRDGYWVKGIPDDLKKATAEYALRALTAELLPDPEHDGTGRMVIGKKEKVGPLGEETTYAQGSASGGSHLIPYPAADRLLSKYVMPSGRNYR